MVDGHTLAMALRAAYLTMHRSADARFARHGVTADQFVVLATLANADAITQRELSRRTGSDPNTIRAMLMLLEDRRFVARAPHPTDGRARIVTLTSAGRACFRRLWKEGEPVRKRLLGALRPGEVQTLLALLDRITSALCPEPARTSS